MTKATDPAVLPHPPERQTCAWSLDDVGGDSVWQTQCGHAFTFNEDGPRENQITFCGYCGKALIEVRTSEPAAPSSALAVPPQVEISDHNNEWNKRALGLPSKVSAEALAVPQSEKVTFAISPIHEGEEDEGPLKSTDLFLRGRGISLLVNATVEGEVTYTCRVDEQNRGNGTLREAGQEAVAVPPERAQTDRAALIAKMRLMVVEMRHEGVNGWPNSVEAWADELAALPAPAGDLRAWVQHQPGCAVKVCESCGHVKDVHTGHFEVGKDVEPICESFKPCRCTCGLQTALGDLQAALDRGDTQ